MDALDFPAGLARSTAPRPLPPQASPPKGGNNPICHKHSSLSPPSSQH